MMQMFSCLAQGQIVKVLVSLQTGGTLLATSVSFVASISQITAEGTIVALSTDSSHNTVMDLILEKGPPLPTGMPNWIFGHRFSVTVSPTAKFAVDSGTFTVPPALASTFTGPSSLLVGQEVQVVVSGTISGITTNAAEADDRDGPLGGADVSFTASSVMLEPSQITGMITTINPTALSFVINEKFVNFWLPPEPETGTPPVPAPVLITVDTTTQTVFDDLTAPNQTSFAGLTAGDLVSVDGWLSNTPMGSSAATTSIIVADKVHGRDTDPDL
jgi:Domain of unknown function (DUF5666)